MRAEGNREVSSEDLAHRISQAWLKQLITMAPSLRDLRGSFYFAKSFSWKVAHLPITVPGLHLHLSHSVFGLRFEVGSYPLKAKASP